MKKDLEVEMAGMIAEISAIEQSVKMRADRIEAMQKLQLVDDRALRDKRQALMRLVSPVKTFRVVPGKPSNIDRLWDPNVRWYELVGTPLNIEELKAAGYGPDSLEPKGMSVAVNVATRHVTTTGGGWFQFPDGTFSRYGERPEEIRAEAQRVWDAIASFVADNPEGGDVTEIVRSHRFLGKEGD